MAARCAWLFGAGRVIVIDCVDYRLEFARNYAPCEAYDFRSLEDPVVFIKRTTESLGADVCIDAVGAEAAGSAMQTVLGRKLLMQGGAATALHWAINSVKKGGIVSIVGVYGPIGTHVPIGNVVNKGITIRANQASVKRAVTATDRARAKWCHRSEGTDHPPCPSGGRVGCLPDFFGEARRLHQAGADATVGQNVERNRYGTYG